MKLISTVLLIFIAASVLTLSQEPTGRSPESAAASVAAPTTARILGNIPDGTPPPPAPPKPEFIVPAKEVLTTATHQQGGRTIAVRQIKPIALPPPPAPEERAVSEPDPEFIQRLAEYRAAHPQAGIVFISASVYRSKDSPPRTFVRYYPEGQGTGISFWSSADFALIAGGIQTFADTVGKKHHLLMGWGNVDIERMSALRTAKGLKYPIPDIPAFPDGKATFQIIGQQSAPDQLVAIHSLHDLYNSEHARLLTAYQGREKARIEHEAYLKAHPPQPKDITLNFWRIEKPASNGKGEVAR